MRFQDREFLCTEAPRRLCALLLASVTLLLSACGSSSDDRPAPPTNVDADRDGVAATSDCDDNNSALSGMLSYAGRDRDADTYVVAEAGVVCSGATLPAGYFATVDATALDCDDDNPGLLRLLSYVGRDRDADTYVVAEAGVVCAGATLPGGYFATVDATALDCDDASAAVWRTASVFIDADLDNVGSGAGDSRCIGTSVPLGSSLVGGDCDDTNATLMASLPYSARDEDGDARQRVESGSLCVGSALPSGYFATLGADVDCDDRDPAKWRVVALYQDIDGDGVGSGPYQLQCIGSYAGPGLSLRGYDPLDSTTDPDSLRVSDFDLGIRIFVDPTPEEEEIL